MSKFKQFNAMDHIKTYQMSANNLMSQSRDGIRSGNDSSSVVSKKERQKDCHRKHIEHRKHLNKKKKDGDHKHGPKQNTNEMTGTDDDRKEENRRDGRHSNTGTRNKSQRSREHHNLENIDIPGHLRVNYNGSTIPALANNTESNATQQVLVIDNVENNDLSRDSAKESFG